VGGNHVARAVIFKHFPRNKTKKNVKRALKYLYVLPLKVKEKNNR